MDGQSLNITEERIHQLRQIFPDVFSEGKIDFNRLEAVLGENVLFSGEHYELSWAGKAEARREVQRQTTATLVPDPEGSFLPNGDAQGSPPFGGTEGGHIFIEGENLEVLRVLQKSYFGKVKMIYIDPPYNTGNDSFVYPDDFAERQEDYLKRTGAKDEAGFLNKQDLWKKNSKENGQFHSVWLSMMYPRLYLARNLMREDGVIFVSIDDNEVANLRLLMDEVFGEENFIECIIWKKRYGGGAKEKYLVNLHEYILMYSKNKEALDPIFIENTQEVIDKYYTKKDAFFTERGPYRLQPLEAAKSMGERKNLVFPVIAPDGSEILPKRQWLWSKERVETAINKQGIDFQKDKNGNWSINIKQYLKDEDGAQKQLKASSLIDGIYTQHGTKEIETLMGDVSFFAYPKPSTLIKKLIEIVNDGDAIILDFFAGSATTAQAVLELNAEDGGNRRFILVQMPEPLEENSEAWKAGYRSIADIGRARIRKVIERLQAQAAEKAKTPGLFEASATAANGQVLGFQSYRLQYSNFKVWRNDLEGKDAILNQLQMFQEPLAEYRGKHSALLTELVLKAGFPLTVEVTEKEVDGCPVFEVDGGRMWVALERVTPAVFQAAAEAKPAQFVTLSELFTGANPDETMSNANLQLKDAGVDFRVI